jgi:hypothetical protein
MTNDDDRRPKGLPTYLPIVDEGELPWYRLWKLKRQISQPGIAHVLYRYGRQVLVVRPEDHQSIWQVVKTRFTSLAAVDVRPYDLTLQGQLPCCGGAHEFDIVVRLTCCVSDPEEILTGNIRDAGARLQRTIFEQIGRVRHEHGVDHVIRAQAAIATIAEELADQLPELEPAFAVTKLSIEVQIDDDLRSLLRAELGREYAESVVRKGPVGIAAFHLSMNAKDPQTAIKILQDDRRDLVQLRREEEEYLIANEIVRPQQLEERALERLGHLEPQAHEKPTTTMPSVGLGAVDGPVVDVPTIDVDYDLRTEEDTNGLASTPKIS